MKTLQFLLSFKVFCKKFIFNLVLILWKNNRIFFISKCNKKKFCTCSNVLNLIKSDGLNSTDIFNRERNYYLLDFICLYSLCIIQSNRFISTDFSRIYLLFLVVLYDTTYPLCRVATTQGICMLTFPHRENTGNLVNFLHMENCGNTGKIVLL